MGSLYVPIVLLLTALGCLVFVIANQKYSYRGITLNKDGQRSPYPYRTNKAEARRDVENSGFRGELESRREWRTVISRIETYHPDIGWEKVPFLRKRFMIAAAVAFIFLNAAVLLPLGLKGKGSQRNFDASECHFYSMKDSELTSLQSFLRNTKLVINSKSEIEEYRSGACRRAGLVLPSP